jgi:hypothetical protein
MQWSNSYNQHYSDCFNYTFRNIIFIFHNLNRCWIQSLISSRFMVYENQYFKTDCIEIYIWSDMLSLKICQRYLYFSYVTDFCHWSVCKTTNGIYINLYHVSPFYKYCSGTDPGYMFVHHRTYTLAIHHFGTFGQCESWFPINHIIRLIFSMCKKGQKDRQECLIIT